ncbi:2,3,4,5-tetrahydropyridine-2,6-dicarboxylate N-acetyltransferase [subsurface metagenome]
MVIGEDCSIQCGVSISNGWKIGNRVFIGPGVRFFNDKYPPSNRLQAGVVEDDAVIGGGVLIGPGVRIGQGAVIGMGANIRKDVLSRVVVVGDGSRWLYERDVYDKKMKQYESDKTT